MRAFVILIGTVAVLISAIILFGDRLLVSRQTIGSYVHTLPMGSTVTNSDANVITGLRWSLQQAKLNPGVWAIPSSSQWDRTSHGAGSHSEGARLLILLSNQVDRSHLYARVSFTNNGQSLQYQLFRPK